MHFTPVEIRETVDMFLGHKLDIRAITLGVSLLDCAASLSLDKLEAKTTVCSVGLDMIVLPGDTSASTISAIIADEMAIGMVNNKMTAARPSCRCTHSPATPS